MLQHNRLIFHSTSKLLYDDLHSIAYGPGYQSKLEHRTSKTQSLRTSGRSIPQQISKVERRERCISMIRERLRHPQLSLSSEIELQDVTHDPGVQYNIGRSQKCPVHIPTFLQKNKGDPTINVSVLRIFLLLICANSSEAEFFAKVKRTSTSLNPNGASSGSYSTFRAF